MKLSIVSADELVQIEQDKDTYYRNHAAFLYSAEPLVIIRQFGTWAVTDFGVECLFPSRYDIAAARLNDMDWTAHMSHKNWVVMADFHAAYIWAKDYHRKAPPNNSPVSPSMRFRVLRRDNYRCRMCGLTADDGATLEIDHKRARAKGGPNTMENLWTLCWDCNRGKSDSELWGAA